MYRAVKVVQRSDFEYEKTFEREFEGIQRYEKVSQDHPGLVDVLHVGRNNEAGFYYYVMELADDETGEHEEVDVDSYKSRTLASDLRRHPGRSVDECVNFGVSVAKALGHLHSAGLTHRDVKPSNIIFVKGQPKLADIGLVARSGQRTFVGTEGYLPPEGPGTSSADLYSLAMVLYEMHTGKDRMDFPELPTNLEIPPTVNRDQWRALNGVICRSGSPDPRKRYDSAHLLANALREVNSSGGVTKPSRKSTRSLGGGIPFTLLVFLVIAGAVGYWVWKDTQSFVETNSDLLAVKETTPVEEVVTNDRPIEEVVVEAAEPAEQDFDLIGDTDDPKMTEGEVVIRDTTSETPSAPEEKDTAPEAEPEPDPKAEPEPEEKEEPPLVVAQVVAPDARIIVESVPSGATVSINGEDQGRTKTKAVELEAGPAEIALKYPGYHDHNASYMIREGTQFVRVQMLLDRSPVSGAPWVNSLGIEFLPDPELNFISRNEIGKEAFSQFRDETGAIISVTAKEGRVIVPDRALQWAFCDWMTEKDREIGFLGMDRYYRPQPVPGGFFYCLLDNDFGTFILNTEPSGARVFFNETYVGDTPCVVNEARLGPYELEFSLPGHEARRVEGELISTEPQDQLVTLVRDNSVVFGQQWLNSQQMDLVRVGDVMVAAYETRVRDFREYATEASLIGAGVAGFPQELTHPAAGISFAEAVAFCDWLTQRERQAGLIKQWQRYRLPTDAEWSLFAGLEESGSTPDERSRLGTASYPWGETWPPTEVVGNYADESSQFAPYIVEGYNDGFPMTSPAGSFAASESGLFDLSGNVWEWVADSLSAANPEIHVLRGGGWSSYDPETLETRYRNPVLTGSKDESYGFRYVLEDNAVEE